MPEAPATSVQCCWTELPPRSFLRAVGAPRDEGTLQGKAMPVPPCSHFCLPWRIWKEKLNLPRDVLEACACYPQDVLPTNQKTFKRLHSSNMIKPLSSLYVLKQHWAHNVAFGLNIEVDLQTAGPVETANRNGFVSRRQSQLLLLLQPSTNQTHTDWLFNVNMSRRSSTHLLFPCSGAVYPHFLHGP